MQALLVVAPSGPLVERLQVIADALVRLNVLWLQDQLAAGHKPPCCTHCAEPPWTGPALVSYVHHHGAAQGELRAYLDGPSMLHVGRGTCIDIAAFDAACRIVKGDPSARARVVDGPAMGDFHCIVVDKDGEHDVVQEFAPDGTCACGK